jgi:tRNA pseudouridine55 synthase
MDGLIILNKPVGLSSAKALYRVRALTGQRKSGHAGTLDPAAAGVLVLCLGRATRVVEQLMNQPKIYRAVARLDVTSDSFDSERPLRPVDVTHAPDTAAVGSAVRSFEGVIQQVPPLVSALKVGGRPAYRIERAGRTVELPPRPVAIYWVHVHSFDWPMLDFEVACGRGTYVRALIRDIGQALGVGGCLTSLVRTAIGPWRLENAWTLDALRSASADQYLIPLDAARRQLDSPLAVPPRPSATLAQPPPAGACAST